MTIAFLLAVLFAIPTYGLSLLLFVGFLVLSAYTKAKSRMHFANESGARRAVANGAVSGGPSWIGTQKETQFFNGVVQIATRKSVPMQYLVKGFASPDSSNVIFSLAAEMEARGSSFSEQQIAIAHFVTESWQSLCHADKEEIFA